MKYPLIPAIGVAILLACYLSGGGPVITHAGDTPAPIPATSPAIELPEIAPTPQPMPAPKPVAVTKLNAAEMYVVQSDAPFIVLSSPANLVTITTDSGPLTIKGQFAGGNGKIVTKKFTKKYITIVEACSTGRVELFVIPDGSAQGKGIIRVTLDVDSGTGPQPPPDPKPDPIPNTPTKFKIVIIEETGEAVATRGSLLASGTLAARIREKGHTWRVVDKDVVDVNGQKPKDIAGYIDASKGKSLPQVFLIDEAGKTRFQGDAPPKAVDLIALIAKYGG